MNQYPRNPYSKYGKRKMREDLQERYNKMSPEEKKDFDGSVFVMRLVLFVIVILVSFIIIALGGNIRA